jgi:dienelactone hydrolase
MRANTIKCPMGALTAEGALIYDENVSGKRPAVLLAPNWLGIADKAVQRGEWGAPNRYVVFVADMYGAGTRLADFGRGGRLGQLAAMTRSSSASASGGQGHGDDARQTYALTRQFLGRHFRSTAASCGRPRRPWPCRHRPGVGAYWSPGRRG